MLRYYSQVKAPKTVFNLMNLYQLFFLVSHSFQHIGFFLVESTNFCPSGPDQFIIEQLGRWIFDLLTLMHTFSFSTLPGSSASSNRTSDLRIVYITRSKIVQVCDTLATKDTGSRSLETLCKRNEGFPESILFLICPTEESDKWRPV